MSRTAITFENISVVYANGKRALHEISFSIASGECFALVGESGCGKTTLARAALGILPLKTKVSGSIKIDDTEIVNAPPKRLRGLRGLVIGFVAQNPFAACQPLATVEDFISEAWRVHLIVPPQNAAESALKNLGIENAKERMRQFPNVWSGGMLQRAAIASASAHAPKLIIADEPTSALDAELNQTVLESFKQTRTAILLISHDLRLIEKYADRIAVIKNGEIVEINSSSEIFDNPQHEYTKRLLAAARPKSKCTTTISQSNKIVLEAKNLSHSYVHNESENRLIKKLNLQIRSGEIIGIFGASGCGKSTLLRLLTTIETPNDGEVWLGGEIAANGKTRRLLSKKARNGFIIPIFQDSVGSLDSRWAIWRIITEPLTAKHRKPQISKLERREIASEKLFEVGLSDVNLDARPSELSIGQCQRVAIARALTANAQIIAADEPTASLDVLSCERVMSLFVKSAEKGSAIVIVSHNEPLLKSFCHRVYRMCNGNLEK
ncbi:MAG: ABC transporter ATP-binding protein [Pyrinomonadaceae bacterium]|nr:ABC transporter ATP-binding protein [Pyrinomonadaceae bacterium]